jgi:RimJ/RimL family protein N-acetyltransferase
MSSIIVRPARPEDLPRIVEISSQIWEGDDYVPSVLDEWMQAPGSLLAVAARDELVIGFGHGEWITPGTYWLEGLRTDPAWWNHGAGRAIFRYFLEWAQSRKAQRIRLSTYLENFASIHLIESHGFQRVARFTYLESEKPHLGDDSSEKPGHVMLEEAAAFIQDSSFCDQAQGFFPRGWRFSLFAQNLHTILAAEKHLLAVRRNHRLAALLAASYPHGHPNQMSVDFLEGTLEEAIFLLSHLIRLEPQVQYWETMIPCSGEQPMATIDAFQQVGFQSWHEGAPDVFVYEKDLRGQVSDPAECSTRTRSP